MRFLEVIRGALIAAPIKLLPVMNIPLQTQNSTTRKSDIEVKHQIRPKPKIMENLACRKKDESEGQERITMRHRGRTRQWRWQYRWRRKCKERSEPELLPTNLMPTKSPWLSLSPNFWWLLVLMVIWLFDLISRCYCTLWWWCKGGGQEDIGSL